MGYRADYLKGWQKAVSQMGTKDRGHSVLPFFTEDARKFITTQWLLLIKQQSKLLEIGI
jgi:hypothetical protein